MFKYFIPIKTGYCFFYIFSICLAVIPYFADISWLEGCANGNVTKNKIVMTFSKIETSTPCLEIAFLLIQNIRLMHGIELFTIWVGLSIICEYPADDVENLSSWHTELVIPFFHQFELRALKSPVLIQRIATSSFLLLNNYLKCRYHLV